MTGWQFVGAGMLVALSGGLIACGIKMIGWRDAFLGFGATALIIGFVSVACILLTGGQP